MPPKKHATQQPGLFEHEDDGESPTLPARQSLVVPFGKFKDQPVDLLLAHSEYALWLLGAKGSMLRRSHPQMYAWLVSRFGVPDTTPEHNRLQNRFLDDDFRLQVVLHLNPGIAEQLTSSVNSSAVVEGWKDILGLRVRRAYADGRESAGDGAAKATQEHAARVKLLALGFLHQAVDSIKVRCTSLQDATADESARFAADGLGHVRRVWRPVLQPDESKFEVDGADVQFDVEVGISVEVNEPLSFYPSSTRPSTKLLEWDFRKSYRVEVKPFVGDDYPVILRSMVAKNCNLLLVESFEADGASWEQVAKVFASRKIRVALLEDVLLTTVPDAIRCLPVPVVDKEGLMRAAAEELDRHIEGVSAALRDFRTKFGVGGDRC